MTFASSDDCVSRQMAPQEDCTSKRKQSSARVSKHTADLKRGHVACCLFCPSIIITFCYVHFLWLVNLTTGIQQCTVWLFDKRSIVHHGTKTKRFQLKNSQIKASSKKNSCSIKDSNQKMQKYNFYILVIESKLLLSIGHQAN